MQEDFAAEINQTVQFTADTLAMPRVSARTEYDKRFLGDFHE
jgi:hypothetical protein